QVPGAAQAPAAGHATQPPTHPATAHAAPPAPPQGFGPPPAMGPGHAPTPPPRPHPYTHPVVGAAPYGPGAPGAPVPQAPAPAPKRKSRAALVAVAAIVAFAVAGGATAYALLKDSGKEDRAGRTQDASSGTPKPATETDTAGQGDGAPAGDGTGADAGTDGGEASPSAPADPPAAPPEPVEYKGIDLTEGYELTLADDPLKPKREGGDIDYGTSGLSTSDGGRLVMLRNGQAGTLETCLNETRYTRYIRDSQMTKGSRVCLQNGAGDVALLTVLGFSPESDPSDYITLDVTVWRGAMDVEQPS
ncbi:serine/threonine protein kinase, partial [Streptomyces fradiae]